MDWKPISEAPTTGDILAWVEKDQCSGPCAYSTEGADELCLYHAHAETFEAAESGIRILSWGGAFDDSTYEYQGGSLPDWWFVYDSEFEIAAMPTHWMPLPSPPEGKS